MAINIMNQYIELTKKQINTYMKLVFQNKFQRAYCDSYTEKYINIRYYNFYDNDIDNTIRKKIIYHLKQTEEDLTVAYIEDREMIEQICIFYYYILYFDNVIYYKDLKTTIGKLTKLRKKVLKEETIGFEEELYKEMKNFIEKKENLLKKFQTNKFSIQITNYPEQLNIFRVNLKYHMEFPMLYSEFAINKAFNMGIVSEDKLEIEYYLVTIQAIKDILKQNFKKQYIVEFADTLLKKPKKLKSLLNSVENAAIQEKVSLKIRYEYFLANREEIYELMRNGFKIAIILDNSFEVNFKDLENLKMFKFIIINRNLKRYEEIMEHRKILHSVIEI